MDILEEMGMVDLEKIEPKIVLDIKYATPDNFVGEILYPVAKCFLRHKVALKLIRIQKRLEREGLGLKVFDGYRPLAVQKKMWAICPDDRYVAPPILGSKHKRGAAVDGTMFDSEGFEL